MKTKFFKNLIVFITVFACFFTLTSCAKPAAGDDPVNPSSDTAADSSVTTPLSPEDTKRTEFLSTVTYNKFNLAGDEPYFVGRWFDKEINGNTCKVTTTAGSVIYILTENCDKLNINFESISDNTPYFAYSIDGNTPIRQEITENTITLPDGEYHTVRIYADAISGEKWTNEEGIAIKNISAQNGNILGIKPSGKLILFYGDSITEGINALAVGNTPSGNSAVNAYPFFCTEKLSAVPYYVGYAASGLAQNGSFRRFVKTIENYSSSIPADLTVIPDVIVINHGTNDSAEGSQKFASALKTAIEKIRSHYPDTPIVYLVPFGQSQQLAITTVMEEVENGYVVQTLGWGVTFSDWGHPNTAGAKNAGEKLADALISILGEDFFN